MELETLLFAAIQSSFLLGLLHGVNPCGHSWLVLAPFVTGEKNGRRVTLLTFSFLAGTTIACLVLGATLGAVSHFIPESLAIWLEQGTSLILLVIGLLLLYNPHILHNHDDHDHQHHHHSHDDDKHCQDGKYCCSHSHGHQEVGIISKLKSMANNKRLLPSALFSIGFVNMIIPCPTAAIMYGYALNAGSVLTATLVFGTYALSTAIAVGGVIFLIFKATKMAKSLQKGWVEPAIMRLAGVIIVIFSGYGFYQTIIT